MESTYTKILSNSSDIHFHNNTSLIGDVYINVQSSCNDTCLNNSVIGLQVAHNNPPRELVLYEPATCISDDEVCKKYLLNDMMLGQDIKVNACVVGFFDQPAGVVDFLVSGNDDDYSIDGPKFVSIACNDLEGIRIIGNEISNTTNFSIHITVSSQIFLLH